MLQKAQFLLTVRKIKGDFDEGYPLKVVKDLLFKKWIGKNKADLEVLDQDQSLDLQSDEIVNNVKDIIDVKDGNISKEVEEKKENTLEKEEKKETTKVENKISDQEFGEQMKQFFKMKFSTQPQEISKPDPNENTIVFSKWKSFQLDANSGL